MLLKKLVDADVFALWKGVSLEAPSIFGCNILPAGAGDGAVTPMVLPIAPARQGRETRLVLWNSWWVYW